MDPELCNEIYSAAATDSACANTAGEQAGVKTLFPATVLALIGKCVAEMSDDYLVVSALLFALMLLAS